MSNNTVAAPLMGAFPDQKRRHEACAYTFLELIGTPFLSQLQTRIVYPSHCSLFQPLFGTLTLTRVSQKSAKMSKWYFLYPNIANQHQIPLARLGGRSTLKNNLYRKIKKPTPLTQDWLSYSTLNTQIQSTEY